MLSFSCIQSRTEPDREVTMTIKHQGNQTTRDLKHRLVFLGLVFGGLALYSVLV